MEFSRNTYCIKIDTDSNTVVTVVEKMCNPSISHNYIDMHTHYTNMHTHTHVHTQIHAHTHTHMYNIHYMQTSFNTGPNVAFPSAGHE